MNTLMNSHMTERISISTGTNFNSKMNEKKAFLIEKLAFWKTGHFKLHKIWIEIDGLSKIKWILNGKKQIFRAKAQNDWK